MNCDVLFFIVLNLFAELAYKPQASIHGKACKRG